MSLSPPHCSGLIVPPHCTHSKALAQRSSLTSANSSHLCLHTGFPSPGLEETGSGLLSPSQQNAGPKSCPAAYLSLPHLKPFGGSSCRLKSTSSSPPHPGPCCHLSTQFLLTTAHFPFYLLPFQPKALQ